MPFDSLPSIVLALCLPVVAGVLGAAIASARAPGVLLRSSLQHFAAGVVFAAVAVELVPEMLKDEHTLALCVGFALGVLTMLGTKSLVESWEERSLGTSSASLLVATGVDLLIDGALVGVGFALGARTGWLLSLALTLELLSVGLATSATLVAAGRGPVYAFATTAGLAILVPVGAQLGFACAGRLTAQAMVGLIAFATAALLYLVTEELLAEAHEFRDTPLSAAMFFVGFLALLVLELRL